MGKTIRGAERELWRKKRDSIRRQIRWLARTQEQANLRAAGEKARQLEAITQILATA